MNQPNAKPPGPDLLNQLGRKVVRKVVRMTHIPRLRKGKPGAAPGIEMHDLAKMPRQPSQRVHVSCIDYCEQHVLIQDILNVDEFLGKHRPEWSKVRWINVDGLSDPGIIKSFAEKYQLHPLAIEDVLHVHQRPKFELYPGEGDTPARLFVVARMLYMLEGHLHSEQISMFLGRNTLLTFQEEHGDIFAPIRERINREGSRLRRNDASFLLYALLDAMVDHCFPLLEIYGDRLEGLENEIMDGATNASIHRIHEVKREMLLLRRAAWPMREMIGGLQREPVTNLSENTRTYLRDVHDHIIQVIDLIETYRDVAIGLTETYMTVMSNRMNEVMKVLTIIATIFIPITFLAGVYGMNFKHFPELDWKYSYAIFWIICLTTAGTMIGWFRKRGWL